MVAPADRRISRGHATTPCQSGVQPRRTDRLAPRLSSSGHPADEVGACPLWPDDGSGRLNATLTPTIDVRVPSRSPAEGGGTAPRLRGPLGRCATYRSAGAGVVYAALRSWSFATFRAKLPGRTLFWVSTDACSLRTRWRAMKVLTTA
jgi:hypothetical protein